MLQVTSELTALGLTDKAIEGILGLIDIESVADLEQLLGQDNEAVVEIKSLFALAESSGCSKYLEFDPSVVRGLAYYTGKSTTCKRQGYHSCHSPAGAMSTLSNFSRKI